MGVIDVVVRFHGPIDRRGLAREHTASLPERSSVAALLAGLGYSERQARSINVLRAGHRCAPATVLEGGEVLDLVVLAGGG
jgi:hypothetical protein